MFSDHKERFKQFRGIAMVAMIAVLCMMGSLPVSAESPHKSKTSGEVGIEGCEYWDSWIDANCTYNRSTVYPWLGVELRKGYYNGKQYGWGRFTASDPDDYLRFEVSFDGGRTVATHAEATPAMGATWAYPTSSDPNRKFRVCVAESYYDPYYCGSWW